MAGIKTPLEGNKTATKTMTSAAVDYSKRKEGRKRAEEERREN